MTFWTCTCAIQMQSVVCANKNDAGVLVFRSMTLGKLAWDRASAGGFEGSKYFVQLLRFVSDVLLWVSRSYSKHPNCSLSCWVAKFQHFISVALDSLPAKVDRSRSKSELLHSLAWFDGRFSKFTPRFLYESLQFGWEFLEPRIGKTTRGGGGRPVTMRAWFP